MDTVQIMRRRRALRVPLISGGASEAFSPRSLSAALWLEASDLTTLFQNIAGSTPVSADGQTVGAWNDKSGAGFNISAAADDSSLPIWNLNAGLSYVSFNGNGLILRRTADLGFYVAGAASIFMAVRLNPNTNAILIS